MMPGHWSLPAALVVRPHGELVAFVGGGGKTSLMFALAATLPGRVVVTTTTRIFAAQSKLAPAVCYADDLSRLGDHLAEHRICLVIGHVEGDKALGIDPSLPGQFLARADVDTVLVEADGSRMRPVKAPAGHEPVIPPGTTLLVPVVGIDALEGPLEQIAHRPERIRQLLNGSLDQESASLLIRDGGLTSAALACLLAHPQGGLKHAPDDARIVPFINKVETAGRLPVARQVARHALRASRVERVLVGAVRSERPVSEVHRRVTAVVLAAGQGTRMGRTKQLLPWGETTVLGQTLCNLQASAVHNITVVVGHEAEPVAAVAAACGVPIVYNPDYAAGEMLSSLKAAVRKAPADCAAVLVMLADQPMVGPETIDSLLVAYWQGQGELIAPFFEGRRGNPVLIGRAHFDELLALPPGGAPRDLLQRHAAEVVPIPVETDAVLRDLDKLEEYERWRP
jgi:molybdenum cofactor cytidylyltransferase